MLRGYNYLCWNMKRKKILIYILLIVFLSLAIACFFVWFANNRIVSATESYIYDNVEDISYNKVGLLLGTSKNLRNGQANPFFEKRIEATAKLYKSGKIKYIVASGDNSKEHYNEPQQMKDDLVALGIPDSVIYLDYAGFRTLDSVVRMEKIFGQKQFTVISQKFHNERAIYIAQYCGLVATGYNAEDVGGKNGQKVAFREKFARVKVFVDFLTGKKPKFLGEKVLISGES